MLFVLQADDDSSLPHASLLGITQPDGHVRVFVLEFIRDQQLIAGTRLARRLRLEDIGRRRGFFFWRDGPDRGSVSADHELGKPGKGVLWSLLIEGPAVKQLTQGLLLEVRLFLRRGFQLDRGYGHRRQRALSEHEREHGEKPGWGDSVHASIHRRLSFDPAVSCR